MALVQEAGSPARGRQELSDSSMALRVEQLSLGPIGTNCYVVRADPTASRSRGRRSERERRRAPAPAGAARSSVQCDPPHARPLGSPRRGRRARGRGTERPVYMAEGERSLLEDPNRFTPPGLTVRPYSPDVLLTGGETIEIAGISFDVLSVPGHSPGPCRVLRGREPLLGRRALRGLGRTHRLSRKRLGHAGRLDPLARRHAARGHGRVPGTRSGDDAR